MLDGALVAHSTSMQTEIVDSKNIEKLIGHTKSWHHNSNLPKAWVCIMFKDCGDHNFNPSVSKECFIVLVLCQKNMSNKLSSSSL